MKVRFELLALFRDRAGAGEIEIEVAAGASPAGADAAECAVDSHRAARPTALEALRCLEARLAPRTLGVVEGNGLRRGVLLFARSPGLPMQRIAEPARRPLEEGDTLVVATAMEGG
jgi:hypothetical protein